ncbi:MAG: sulfatase-like hydrolase/transferase [Aestuariibaculum sp.]
MKIKILVLEICFSLLCMVAVAQKGNKDYSDTPKPNNGPNIIFIYVDDLGYGDLGNFWQNQRKSNQKFKTPNLDVMANEGAMLTHHYTSAPVCAPARASLLEGLHQGHSSVRDNQFDKAIKEGLTMAQMLSLAGYRTLHVGKAGLAGKRGAAEPKPENLPGHPLKRGFDQFFGYLFHIQGHQHYPQNGTTKQRAYFTNGYTNILNHTDLTYTTDVFTAKTKQWIVEHEAKRPRQPFFVYLSYDSPHAQLQVPTQAYPKGGGLNGGVQWMGENARTPWVNTASGTPDSYIHPDYANTDWNETEKRHATMIRRLDYTVADIIQLLKDLKIDDNTMIVFSSDNGPHHEMGSGGKYEQDPEFFQSYANMNGTKRDMWEAGIRVPTICRFPNVIPKKSIVDFPSGQWDWMATFADLANIPVPVYTDGVSLMPSLKNNPEKQVDKGYTYHEYNNNSKTKFYEDFEPSKRGRLRKQMQVIRMGDYKGVRYNIENHTTPFEIYNVVTDEREKYNLADSLPELEKRMHDKVLQVRMVDASAVRTYDDGLVPSVTIASKRRGLVKKVFEGKYDWVPNFDYLVPVKTSKSKSINVKPKSRSGFGVSFHGYIDIPADGAYTFYLQSAAKCHVMLHDMHVLDNDFVFTNNEQSVTVNLKAGYHPIRVFYQQNNNTEPLLSLKLSGDGMFKDVISKKILFSEK